ncbi:MULTISPECIES: phosphatidylserine decarboxylase [unclassified Deinococcus]|uniref:phosphatidylserine decarboxylase n=1 Tax=unclassified Deinococcus TaxID=2623546 RepID=UPI001E459862|nr:MULTISPECIES: phosphatidylserine decarboxylase [unclassified Deinococcus]MCD0157378.1 phosphatidylserine decarboxylase [Deinococcus sp. 6GRE01]MCD0165527.1 phosphatidylserine decarboxylase [Deinococcus sp. 12RED42]
MRVRSFLPLVAAGAALWYVRSVYRFRDPVRLPQVGPGEVLSPADGTVSFVRRVQGTQVDGVNVAGLLNVPEAADGWLVGIFVGPLDAHYTYQPVAGTVTQVTHRAAVLNVPLLGAGAAAGFLTGRASDLLGGRGTLENERLSSVTVTPFGNVTVTLVAPGAGLRVTSYQQAGDEGRAGFKAAFLEEGGLVLLHLPGAFTPSVGVGERVLGAQTVAARADN